MPAESGSTLVSEKSALGDRALLTLLPLGHLVNDWVAGTIWIIAPAVAASLGLGPTEVGLILAVNGIAAGLTYIPAGLIADRVSAQGTLMMISFIWVAVGYFTATLVDGFWAITLLFALGVAGDAFWHPVATGTLVKRMPGRRAQVLGIHAMGGSIGAEILGPVSAGMLLSYFDWKSTMQILIIPAVLMALLFVPIAGRIRSKVSTRLAGTDIRELAREWGTGRGARLVFIMVAYNMGLYGMLAMTPLVLQSRYGLSPFVSATVFASMLVIGTLMQPWTGQFSDRIGRKPVSVTMILAASIFAFGCSLSEDFLLFVVLLIASITLLTAVRPVLLASAVEFSNKSESTTLGLVFAILDGVGALGALVAGYAGEWDLSYAYFIGAFLALGSAVTASLFRFNSQHGR